ncbi:MAG: S46 family peptidase [Candidatus Zixiibacteriota bacterium]|nr:MAG: S46 family peptidase [candidate division Zixibacteria bacterium]
MLKRSFLIVAGLCVLAVLSSGSYAEEGMWLLNSIDKLPIDSLRALGLELAPEQIYDPDGGGVADAVVRVRGSSGSFVSVEGLIITNHHVAFGAVQRQSTPEHNYLRDGFYAQTKEEELPAIGYDLSVLKSMEDVTGKVLGAVKERMSDLERYQAIEKVSKKIIREAEEGQDVKCRLASMYGGSQYYLFTYFKIRDVRLVFVPPSSIGDYGGEIDNWMWPRHAGDFAFLRAYVAPDGKSAEYSGENVPYDSKAYLELSSSGVGEGGFVMLIGFPGKTRRYENSFFIDEKVNHDYPRDIQTRKEVISILEDASAGDSSVAIRLSSTIKGLNNYLKKNQGMLEGFRRAQMLRMKKEEERLLSEFLNANRGLYKKYGGILPELDSLYKERKKYEEKRFVINWMTYRSKFLDFASTIYKWTLEKKKEDPDREPGYQDRDTLDTREWLEEAQVNLVPSADKEVLAYFLLKALELPPGRKMAATEKSFEGKQNADKESLVEQFVDDLYRRTRLGSVEERLRMFNMSKEELEKLNDPFIDFARELEEDREELRAKRKEFSGALTRLEPKLIQAYAEWKKRDFYPDANGTIRFNYGTVKGYVPRDAVAYSHLTSLTGVMEKDTGEEPFDAPKELEEVYSKRDFGSYLDASIGDVPVNFLSTHDITNGNSGSPVMNGRGQLVGLAFDGNYESISADYLFEPEITRAINVDIRYVLFLLDKVYPAENLLEELTIR